MTRTAPFRACAALVLASAPAAAQAATVLAPERDYLLEVAREWARESPLGDLRARPMGPGDVELRLWGGFGLGGTSGVVLRREAGRWSAWRAEFWPCRLSLSMSAYDALSTVPPDRYRAEVRRRCGELVRDTLPPETVVLSDTLALLPLPPGRAAAAWEGAVRAGVLRLPPAAPRGLMQDGHTYVVEVRRGGEYRASVIAPIPPLAAEADRLVQAVDSVVRERLERDP